MAQPVVSFKAEGNADGLVSYSWHDFEIVGSVNGPIEAQRRDELPEEAFVEVIIRPTSGAGSPRERLLERLVHSVLHSIILLKRHPRTLIQVTLQLIRTPLSTSPIVSRLPHLPHLLHTALLALLAANIPLSTVFTATSVGVNLQGLNPFPTPAYARTATSLHAFAITTKGDVLLAESEGDFGPDVWDNAAEIAETVCLGNDGLEGWLRTVVAREVSEANNWRIDL